jgi:NAD(P)-dependent dehydrogenase (short-subunit alcohol dehydrogenase family)
VSGESLVNDLRKGAIMSSMTPTNSTRRLEDKTAVIFGAGGEVGSAVATELAVQGARVFLSGRTKTHVQEVAQTISSHGGTAAAAEVDALDEDAVTSYLDDVAAAADHIDILFNAMGPQAVEYRNATSTMELAAEAFMRPLHADGRDPSRAANDRDGCGGHGGAQGKDGRHHHLQASASAVPNIG